MSRLPTSARSASALAATAILAIAGTGCVTVGSTYLAPALPSGSALRAACTGLAGRTVEPSKIALPSGRATVTSAEFVAATSTAAAAAPDHCRVLGRIDPVDPAAELIQFQLNLPPTWNRKALQYGCTAASVPFQEATG